MKRRKFIQQTGMAMSAVALAHHVVAGDMFSLTAGETEAKGMFLPDWESLKQYSTPDWFRDAKFGIWAHWGPQCQPEYGDWYARGMYEEGSWQYKYHVEKYGHPSKFGFKDVIYEWKAENWNPEQLLELYTRAGAKYFVALANHHDNFDTYDSKYQKQWNAVNMGPKKDIISGWEKAARKNGLRFGVSVHAAHAWSWFEVARKADKNGPLAGVPYDGKLTKADGKGAWWEGLDPQGLYAQTHALSADSDNPHAIHRQWNWGNGATPPDKKYADKFFNRTVDLINKYNPDLVYFDDSQFPLWPVSDVGLRIAAHYYNRNMKRNGGKLEAVINGKILDAEQRKTMVWDVERGASNEIEALPWQTCTCIGNWHYDRPLYERNGYKSAQTVIHALADVVSKNGNLLLSVPVRGNGTIDEKEQKIVEEIAAWMSQYGECIYATRPWKIFGEGPALENVAPLSAQGFNEGKGKPFTGQDIRFTAKGDTLYAIPLGAPTEGRVVIKSLGEGSANYAGRVGKVELVPNKQALAFSRSPAGLVVELPDSLNNAFAYGLKILPA